MPTNRFQFSDDFVLKNGKVGINTAEPQEKLEVLGTIIADNIRASDISNLHTYEGFLNQNQNIDENLTISSDTTTSLSGEIIVGDDATVTIGPEATSSQGNIDSLKVYNTFTVPTGGTEERPRKVKPGQLYYNVDFKTIEFWDGNVWRQVDNTTRSGRVVIFGGLNGPSAQSTIQYFNAATQGNAIDFGSASSVTNACSGVSDSTRGIFNNGYNTPTTNLEYITIASQGNSISFGSLSVSRYRGSSHSSSTRGLFLGGRDYPGGASTNVIDYIQIQTLGNAIDFGDLYKAQSGQSSGMGSPTRAFTMGGYVYNDIQVVTISSKGNAVNFGSLTYAGGYLSACSNSIRGFGSGGLQFPGSSTTKHINTLTLSTQGNAVSFGDLTSNKGYGAGASSNTRGFYIGGISPSINVIDFWNISSSGNAQDFGDQVSPLGDQGACSDSHGGLGGF